MPITTLRSTQLRDRDMTRSNPFLQPSRQANTDMSATIPYRTISALSATMPALQYQEGHHRHPARHASTSPHDRERPNPEPYLAVNENTVTTTVNRFAVNPNATMHTRPVTTTPLNTPATGQTDPRSSPTYEGISEREDDRQDD
jgi:hypothetical protein